MRMNRKVTLRSTTLSIATWISLLRSRASMDFIVRQSHADEDAIIMITQKAPRAACVWKQRAGTLEQSSSSVRREMPLGK